MLAGKILKINRNVSECKIPKTDWSFVSNKSKSEKNITCIVKFVMFLYPFICTYRVKTRFKKIVLMPTYCDIHAPVNSNISDALFCSCQYIVTYMHLLIVIYRMPCFVHANIL